MRNAQTCRHKAAHLYFQRDNTYSSSAGVEQVNKCVIDFIPPAAAAAEAAVAAAVSLWSGVQHVFCEYTSSH